MDITGIANLSTVISQYNVKEAIGVSVLKMALDSAETTGQQLIEMGDVVALDSIDVKV